MDPDSTYLNVGMTDLTPSEMEVALKESLPAYWKSDGTPSTVTKQVGYIPSRPSEKTVEILPMRGFFYTPSPAAYSDANFDVKLVPVGTNLMEEALLKNEMAIMNRIDPFAVIIEDMSAPTSMSTLNTIDPTKLRFVTARSPGKSTMVSEYDRQLWMSEASTKLGQDVFVEDTSTKLDAYFWGDLVRHHPPTVVPLPEPSKPQGPEQLSLF